MELPSVEATLRPPLPGSHWRPPPPDRHWLPGKNIPALRRGRASKWDEIGWQLLGNLIINVNRLSVTSLRSVLRDLGIGSKSTSEDLPQVVLGKLTCIHRKTIQKYKGMVEAGVKPVYTEEHVAIGTVESDQCEPELPECLTEPTDVCLTEPTDVSREEELLKIEKYLEEEIFPQKGKLTLWQAHPNYGPGMRLAELATQWLVNGHSWNQWSGGRISGSILLKFPASVARWIRATIAPRMSFGTFGTSRRFSGGNDSPDGHSR